MRLEESNIGASMDDERSVSCIELAGAAGLPALIAAEDAKARERFIEFFTATIRNRGTRAAYIHAVSRFLHWCAQRRIPLRAISAIVVATYIEELSQQMSAPTVKLHLAAIRRLFDHLVTGHIVRSNPATSVKGPKHVVRKGTTPVLLSDEARHLLDSIDISTIKGLRDRALISVMFTVSLE